MSVLSFVARRGSARLSKARITQAAEAALVTDQAGRFIDHLDSDQLLRLDGFVSSPEFAHMMLRTLIARVAAEADEINGAIREELRASLRREQLFEGADLIQAADVMSELLQQAALAVQAAAPGVFDTGRAVAIGSQIATASARNSALVQRIETLVDINACADRIRTQVRALHNKVRLPTVVANRAVPYAQLYVTPALRVSGDGGTELSDAVARELMRYVVVGDPGAGKSTLAAKLAHDIAANRIAGMEGQVPLLLAVRSHTSQLRSEQHTLVHYLEASCRAPYNVDPPADCLEYLLLNGRAVVILDGLDELGDSSARQRFVDLVATFTNLYPLARIVATSREIGYEDAPLDPELFPTARIEPFDDDQVKRYVRNWFGLDTASRLGDSLTALSDKFLGESQSVLDLRRNPLMLSLLCALYSSEHFIPANRPEIYQRCSELLYETWDKSRGIETAMPYKSSVRPVVQQLAWRLFTDRDGRQALPRSEMERFLATSVFAQRFDTPDEAAEAASDFLTFCAGRAWVLTDTGSDPLQPHYGFTHRTFLEYFAAVRLVRQDPSAAAIWAEIGPMVGNSSWEVMSVLAAQILDRDREGALDQLLTSVLDAAEAARQSADATARSRFLTYAAQLVDVTVPTNDVLRRLATAAVDLASDLPGARRSVARAVVINGDLYSADMPLGLMLNTNMPENAKRVARAVLDRLHEVITVDGEVPQSATLIAASLISPPLIPMTTTVERALAELGTTLIDGEQVAFARTLLIGADAAVIERVGAIDALYKQWVVCHVSTEPGLRPLVRTALAGDDSEAVGQGRERLDTLYQPIVTGLQSSRSEWNKVDPADWAEIPTLVTADRLLALTPTQRGCLISALLPVLGHPNAQRPADERISTLVDARQDPSRQSAAVAVLNELTLPREAHDLLLQWLRTDAATVRGMPA